MELMPAHTGQPYCPNGPSLNLTVSSAKKDDKKTNELCYLPELEITPVMKTNCVKSVTESSMQSTSVEADTLKDRNSKEKGDMENLLKRLPILNQYFHLHNKIGEGTFSTVYLATMKNSKSNKKYAIKHLTQSHQKLRIETELRCMTEIGGKDNVVHAHYCFASKEDCVTFVMPYLPHKKFCDYVLQMNADETRLYMKNLFIALRRVHSFNVIHRDVKPGNFLYNRETKEFLLVDFGLAQAVQNHSFDKIFVPKIIDENLPIDYSKKRKRKESVSDKEKTTPSKKSKRIALKSKDSNVKLDQISNSLGNSNVFNNDDSLSAGSSQKFDSKSPVKLNNHNESRKANIDGTPLKSKFVNSINLSAGQKKPFNDSSLFDGNKLSKNSRDRYHYISMLHNRLNGRGDTLSSCTSGNDKSFTPLVSSKSSSGSFVQIQNSKVVRHCEMAKSRSTEIFQKYEHRTCVSEYCSCSGRGAICAMCSSRGKMVAPRAGTPGFRPPEVLFKYLNQTTAVDMWASGVILLCILSGCYPFFKSSNDLVALAEIMTVFGTEPIIKIAAKFGRRVICSHRRKGVDLKKLCKRLRSRTTRKESNAEKNSYRVKCEECLQYVREDGCLCPTDDPEQGSHVNDQDCEFPDSAFDLLKRLLDLDPTTRITAAEALEHPFILGF